MPQRLQVHTYCFDFNNKTDVDIAKEINDIINHELDQGFGPGNAWVVGNKLVLVFSPLPRQQPPPDLGNIIAIPAEALPHLRR